MVSLCGTFSRLKPCRVLVAGDLMVDTYTVGKVGRISPEAPVCVLRVDQESHRPGGAANAALNLISLGCQVTLMGRVGNDAAGARLKSLLEENGVDCRGVLIEEDFQTPVKKRLIAANQQILRVDYERASPLSLLTEEQSMLLVASLLRDTDIVAVSDYAKGYLSNKLLRTLIDQAQLHGIPVIVDPKGSDYSKYSGATVVKPNFSEALQVSGMQESAPIDEIARRVIESSGVSTLFMTRSEHGISIFRKNAKRQDFPVKAREVKDVTGAGDTVLAVLTYCYACGLSLAESAQFANIAAGIAIERIGCVHVSLGELARGLLEQDSKNKVFDNEHLYALQIALRNRRCVVLGISQVTELTNLIFESIKQLTADGERHLIVYIGDTNPNPSFVRVLASIHEVQFIILKSENLQTLSNTIQPEEVYAIDSKGMRSVLDTSLILNFVS